MRDALRRFTRDRRGSIGLYMAIAILPITLLVGAATDFRRIEMMRSALQDASDAAVLAGAKAYLGRETTDAGRLDAARAAAGQALTANLEIDAGQLAGLAWDVVPAGGELVLTTRGRVPLAFAGVFGLDDVPLQTVSASVVDISLEVALVLDTTGSMNSGGKLAILKASTNQLIDQLAAAARQSTRPNPLKLALVPYSYTVRVSPTYAGQNWLDGRVDGSGYWSDAAPRPEPVIDRFASYGPAGWAGCLEHRPYPFDVNNAPPTASEPNSLYAPWWNPDAAGTPAALGDPNSGCAISPVVKLTPVKLAAEAGALKAAVTAMTAEGWTNIPMGLAWGWNVLTPTGGPFGASGAEPYSNFEVVKAVVLLTDGRNEVGNTNEELYTGLGRMEQRRLGMGSASTHGDRSEALDGRLEKLCAEMKKRKIVIYAVRVEVEDGSDAALKACAHEPNAPFYHDVRDARELPDVFARVGEDLIKLRLSR